MIIIFYFYYVQIVFLFKVQISIPESKIILHLVVNGKDFFHFYLKHIFSVDKYFLCQTKNKILIQL